MGESRECDSSYWLDPVGMGRVSGGSPAATYEMLACLACFPWSW